MAKIAVVDDDAEWGELLLYRLKALGHKAVYYPTAGRFFDALINSKPDLAILDMQLTGIHGREIIRVLRANAETSKILIVAISGHDVKSEQAVKAFEAGADEYLAKPVEEKFLEARLKALLRRCSEQSGTPESEKIRSGDLILSPDERKATIGEKVLDLTNLEFELLCAFARQPNRVMTRGLILQKVWNIDADTNTRTVDKHVESLRRKMGEKGLRLETVVGIGYLWRA